MNIADRSKIAFTSPVGALSEIDPADELWNEKVQVTVTLAMGMGAHVPRHAIDPNGKVGSMIEIIAT